MQMSTGCVNPVNVFSYDSAPALVPAITPADTYVVRLIAGCIMPHFVRTAPLNMHRSLLGRFATRSMGELAGWNKLRLGTPLQCAVQLG